MPPPSHQTSEYQLTIGGTYIELPILREYLGFGVINNTTFGSISPNKYKQYNISSLAVQGINGSTYGIFIVFDNADIGDTLTLKVYGLEVPMKKVTTNNTFYYREQNNSDAQDLFQIFSSSYGLTIPIFLS
jgi:hypothetical protein